MVAHGVMYDIRQSRVPEEAADWHGVTEVSAGPTGERDLVVD